MPGLSGITQFTARAPVGVPPAPFPAKPLPQRTSRTLGAAVVGKIASTPNQRAGAVAPVSTSVSVGGTTDSNSAAKRLHTVVAAKNQSVPTPAASVASLANGVIGCVGVGTSGSDCLSLMLKSPLLDVNAKALLCSLLAAAQKAAKAQVDATGNAILRSASELTAAAAQLDPLNTLAKIVNGFDQNALAQCLGAQQLKDLINGQLKNANNAIAAASSGVTSKLADTFSKASAATAQIGSIGGIC